MFGVFMSTFTTRCQPFAAAGSAARPPLTPPNVYRNDPKVPLKVLLMQPSGMESTEDRMDPGTS